MPSYEIVSFDCYGTLIDWEQGMRDALAGLLRTKGLSLSLDALLERYGVIELDTEQGAYRKYREVLATGVKQAFQAYGVKLTEAESEIFADTLPLWPAFPETKEVLAELKKRGCKLVILSNNDNDLIRGSVYLMGIDFDGVITSEAVRSYKPSANHWNRMLDRFNVAKGDVLHVGASYVHDVAPSKGLGFTVAWINRKGEARVGAARPDYEFPDLRPLLAIF